MIKIAFANFKKLKIFIIDTLIIITNCYVFYNKHNMINWVRLNDELIPVYVYPFTLNLFIIFYYNCVSTAGDCIVLIKNLQKHEYFCSGYFSIYLLYTACNYFGFGCDGF